MIEWAAHAVTVQASHNRRRCALRAPANYRRCRVRSRMITGAFSLRPPCTKQIVLPGGRSESAPTYRVNEITLQIRVFFVDEITLQIRRILRQRNHIANLPYIASTKSRCSYAVGARLGASTVSPVPALQPTRLAHTFEWGAIPKPSPMGKVDLTKNACIFGQRRMRSPHAPPRASAAIEARNAAAGDG